MKSKTTFLYAVLGISVGLLVYNLFIASEAKGSLNPDAEKGSIDRAIDKLKDGTIKVNERPQ